MLTCQMLIILSAHQRIKHVLESVENYRFSFRCYLSLSKYNTTSCLNLCSYLGRVYLNSILLYDRLYQICISTQRKHLKYVLLLLLFVINYVAAT